VHRYLDLELFGKSYWRIHREMDKPYIFLGKAHRVLFHDPCSALAIARRWYPHDDNAKLAALFHIQIDNICSENPILKAQLKFLANKDAKERASSKRRKCNPRIAKSGEKGKKKPADPAKEFARFLKKAMEFKALAEDFLK
jgi:hypothetical protein